MPFKKYIPEENIAYRSKDRDVRKRTIEGSTRLQLASSIIEFCENSFDLKPSPLLTTINKINNIKNRCENFDINDNLI